MNNKLGLFFLMSSGFVCGSQIINDVDKKITPKISFHYNNLGESSSFLSDKDESITIQEFLQKSQIDAIDWSLARDNYAAVLELNSQVANSKVRAAKKNKFRHFFSCFHRSVVYVQSDE